VTIGGDEVTGRSIEQKPTGEEGRLRVGCRIAMWEERRNHHTMISKQQPKYYGESNPRSIVVRIKSV